MNARDISMFKQTLAKTTLLSKSDKAALVKAREAVESTELSVGERADVADDIGNLATELAKPELDEGRVQTLLKRIKAAAPTVLSVLKSMKIVSDLM